MRRKLKCLLAVCSVVLAAQIPTVTTKAQDTLGGTLAPVLNEDAPNVIPDQYIVAFKPGASPGTVLGAKETVKSLHGEVLFTYDSAVLGFSFKGPSETVKAPGRTARR